MPEPESGGHKKALILRKQLPYNKTPKSAYWQLSVIIRLVCYAYVTIIMLQECTLYADFTMTTG